MKKEEIKLGKPPTGIDADVRKERKGEAAVILGDRVLQRRLALGLTQPQVAEQSQLGLNTIKRMEKANADQKLSAIEQVAKALKVPAWQLLK